MLEVGWSEILVIALILIIVVGPKELPGMLRTFGKMATRLRGMANEFKGQFDEALREAELDDVRKGLSEVNKLNPTNALRDAINPLRQLGQDIKSDLQKASDSMKPDALVARPEDKIPEATTELQPAGPVVAAPAVTAVDATTAAVAEPTLAPAVEAGKTKPGTAAATPAAFVAPTVAAEALPKKPAARKKAAAAIAGDDPKPVAKSPKAPSKSKSADKKAEDAVAEPKKPAPRQKAAKAGEA